MSVASQALRMSHAADPREEILKRVGDFSEIRVGGHDVLVAVYMGAEKTAGGIILPDSKKDDYAHQGKVGLVLKLGPLAYAEGTDAEKWFGDNPPKEGDWIVFNVNTAWPVLFGKETLRLVEAQYVRAIVESPDKFY